MQGDSSPRSGAGDLFQPEAQTAAGIVFVEVEQTILGFYETGEVKTWLVSQV
jgi:hypothetical protein